MGANIHQSSNTLTSSASKKVESSVVVGKSNGIVPVANKIGSGKNSAFQRVISTNRGNIEENHITQSLRQSALADQQIGSSGSSTANSTTSSPQIAQMIYQQPPKPRRQINSSNNNTIDNKRSPPNLQHIQVIYDSSGNTSDQLIYHAQPQQHLQSGIEEENTSTPRRHLLEEKR